MTVALILATVCAPAAPGGGSRVGHGTVRETIVLSGDGGLCWKLQRTDAGWALGQAVLFGRPVGGPLRDGLMLLRNGDGRQLWLAADTVTRIDARSARLSGSTRVDGVGLRFEVEVSLEPGMAAASIRATWEVDGVLDGWEVCLPYRDVDGAEWRCTLYPFAADAPEVRVPRLTYVGVPGALIFRPDMSLVALYGIDPASDYLDPTSWTSNTGFHFASEVEAEQFRLGGPFSPGTTYSLPLQVLISDAGSATGAIRALVRDWMRLNDYTVQPLQVRTPNEALALFVEGRRRTALWYPGKGYRIQDAWAVIYMPEVPGNAYLDYLLYEQTGDTVWRQRAFEAMDFVLTAQHTDPADPNRGAIESHYDLEPGIFASTDRGGNPGLKPDMNAMAARYMLTVWQRVREHEGLDRRDWYDAAVRIAGWVVRVQNPDGGLPQVVGSPHEGRTQSVVSGRALVAFPIIRRITRDAKYDAFIKDLERFLREHAEDCFRYTGAHTDLPPEDLEADSVWQVTEYWLNKHEWTRDKDALKHAEANALFAFLMWCPKQLSWVRNPTQTCHAEQQHYLQYSNYCYTNAKIACLRRLAAFTGDALYQELADRVMQCGFWAQETEGEYIGWQYERMSDPWKGVSDDIDSKGTRYMSELALELHLQLLETGLARAE